jgi:GR25 family glycosyltransferase involved in LPS biosynthesis
VTGVQTCALPIFFQNTDVIVIEIPGVFTDEIYYDARFDGDISVSKGAIGCSLAHVNALKIAIDNMFDYVFIFEDDVRITNNNYYELKECLDNLPPNDLVLLTNCGFHQGIGHDGRIHKNTHINKDYMYTTCPFGTQCYYVNKEITRILYDTQLKMIELKKIHIADGLHIHCEKEKDVFLKIITPINSKKFFEPSGVKSIREHL